MFSRITVILFFIFSLVFPLEAQEEPTLLSGRAFVPQMTEAGKTVERFFSHAGITVIDLTTGKTVARGVTSVSGSYLIEVPPGGPYLLQFIRGRRVIFDLAPEVREGVKHHLSFARVRSTAMTLVILHLLREGKNPASVIAYRANRILRAEDFPLLEKRAQEAIVEGKDIREDETIKALTQIIADRVR